MKDLNYQALLKQAHSAAEAREWLLAERIGESLLAMKKNDPVLLALLAHVATCRQRYDEAVKLLEKCLVLDPKGIRFHVQMGRLHTRMGRDALAVKQFEKARRISPDHPIVVGGLADAYERAGEQAKARAVLEPFVQSSQMSPIMAMVWARLLLNEKKPAEAIDVLVPHAGGSGLPPGFLFSLGLAYERNGDLQKAFDSYCRANAAPLNKFDLDAFIQTYRDVIKIFDRATMARLPHASHPTQMPIFIAGRPRSGTTLVEKILDAHPLVMGVGELPHIPAIVDSLGFNIGSSATFPQCARDLELEDVNRLSVDYLEHVRRLARGARHTVDKTLTNYEHLGLFALLFPQCRVIHVRRAALDNCWAIFTADMSYSWTAELRTLGITQALYERIMQHWHESLDLPILDVDYEQIVEDQEGQTRRILEFCGLPWDDRCMRYNEVATKNKGASIPTLSYQQVRQPIYRSSLNRSERFEPFLGPLRDGLEEGRKLAATM